MSTLLGVGIWKHPTRKANEKPSFLLFGDDCQYPTEAALLPPNGRDPAMVEDYREELILNLSHACTLPAQLVKLKAGTRLALTNIPGQASTRLENGFLLGFPMRRQEPIGSCPDLCNAWTLQSCVQ